jgi:hypothetical protein
MSRCEVSAGTTGQRTEGKKKKKDSFRKSLDDDMMS